MNCPDCRLSDEVMKAQAAKIEELEKAFQTQVRERYKLIIKVKDKAKEILTEEELNLICQHPETRVDEYLKAIVGEPPGFPEAGATDKEWRKYLAHEFANSLSINFKLEAKLATEHENFLAVHRENMELCARNVELKAKLEKAREFIKVIDEVDLFPEEEYEGGSFWGWIKENSRICLREIGEEKSG